MAAERPPRDAAQVIRSILLALAATWLLVAAFMRVESDSPHEAIALLQRLAFGGALLAVALIDWRPFRWWWLLVALVVLMVAWTATGHPLFFGLGAI
jgi:glucan phosphoethanolaminetransferase (alkaline phosphatase superfamily)